MVLAPQTAAAQIQDRPRRHSHEGPRDGRAYIRALAQDGIQGAGVAAARAGRERPRSRGDLRVGESRRARGQGVRDAVRHQALVSRPVAV